MVPVLFLAPKIGTELSCTIYKIRANFSLSLDISLALEIHTNGTEHFGRFGKKIIPKINFHEDETFHLNSPQNFRVFHTNGKPS